MAKGEDATRRKRNKANRKKLHKDASSSAVSARVAAIIASKKRRKSGKRRICEGMCFSLPTPEDPFNDRHEKKGSKRQKTKKLVPSQHHGPALKNGTLDGNRVNVDHQELQRHVKNIKNEQKAILPSNDNVGEKSENSNVLLPGKAGISRGQQQQSGENSDCPSKFLIMCLKSIQSALRQDATFNCKEEKPLFVNEWGVEFWKCYSSGIDILETSRTSTSEQIAWIVSTAADTMARKEKEGLIFTSPFLLFLIPSQEKAAKVRAVCKPLKALGIHTVSLHLGASLDHQIHGLKSCEPEFLVATPERLLELISVKAIDISGVSLLVVDGLETLLNGGYLDMIKSIRQLISGNPHAVVFSEGSSCTSVSGVEDLLRGSYCRLLLKGSLNNQSACIAQPVQVRRKSIKAEQLSR